MRFLEILVICLLCRFAQTPPGLIRQGIFPEHALKIRLIQADIFDLRGGKPRIIFVFGLLCLPFFKFGQHDVSLDCDLIQCLDPGDL